jgi:hypothetical protein
MLRVNRSHFSTTTIGNDKDFIHHLKLSLSYIDILQPRLYMSTAKIKYLNLTG